MAIINKNNEVGDDWEQNIEQEIVQLESQLLENGEELDFLINNSKEKIILNQFYLNNNIHPENNKMWVFFYGQIEVIIFVAISLIIFILSYQKNKRDLLNFIDSRKIFKQRLLAYLSAFIILSSLLLAVCILIGLIAWPGTILNFSIFEVSNNSVKEISVIALGAKKIFSLIATCSSFIIVAYVIQSLLDSTFAYVFFALFYIVGNYLNTLISNELLLRISYFSNLDLTQFIGKDINTINSITYTDSLIKILIYNALFICIGFILFNIEIIKLNMMSKRVINYIKSTKNS